MPRNHIETSPQWWAMSVASSTSEFLTAKMEPFTAELQQCHGKHFEETDPAAALGHSNPPGFESMDAMRLGDLKWKLKVLQIQSDLVVAVAPTKVQVGSNVAGPKQT